MLLDICYVDNLICYRCPALETRPQILSRKYGPVWRPRDHPSAVVYQYRCVEGASMLSSLEFHEGVLYNSLCQHPISKQGNCTGSSYTSDLPDAPSRDASLAALFRLNSRLLDESAQVSAYAETQIPRIVASYRTSA